MLRGALMSPDEVYRYSLWREWAPAPGTGRLVVIGLNPSTADAYVDDPTIRRCIAFAKREGCSALTMLNLFGLRSTDPAKLYTCAEPVGGMNDEVIESETSKADVKCVVAAWGAHGGRWPRRVARIRAIVPPLNCFGVTKDGHPKHPLYLRADSPVIAWADSGPTNSKRGESDNG